MTVPKCVGCGESVVDGAAVAYGTITGVYRCGGGYCKANTAFVHRGHYRSPGSTLERTEAEKYVIDKLMSFLTGDTPYRVGVVLLSYASELPDDACRIAGGFAMGNADLANAVDTIQMIKRLRGLADELEALAKGNMPLPVQRGGVDG